MSSSLSSAVPNSPAFFVLGATGGIGGALVRRLVANGSRVYLAGRNSDKLKALGDELGAPYVAVDGRDVGAIEKAYLQGLSHFGEFSGAVNLIGSILLKPVHLTSASDWGDVIGMNLTSAFGLVRAAAARFGAEGGSIVLMSSAAASIGLPNHEAIAAAKGGVEGLVRSAAATYAARKVRVNAIAPGLVTTPLTERIWGQERSAEASRGMHPLGRFGSPEEIAAAIEWFLSSKQSWITGQVLGVDGGLSKLKRV